MTAAAIMEGCEILSDGPEGQILKVLTKDAAVRLTEGTSLRIGAGRSIDFFGQFIRNGDVYVIRAVAANAVWAQIPGPAVFGVYERGYRDRILVEDPSGRPVQDWYDLRSRAVLWKFDLEWIARTLPIIRNFGLDSP